RFPPPPLSFLCFYCSGHLRDLHSFPTRRSSDLTRSTTPPTGSCSVPSSARRLRPSAASTTCRIPATRPATPWRRACGRSRSSTRSEEHTSELQSRENLVCRLLLEKKKKQAKGND